MAKQSGINKFSYKASNRFFVNFGRGDWTLDTNRRLIVERGSKEVAVLAYSYSKSSHLLKPCNFTSLLCVRGSAYNRSGDAAHGLLLGNLSRRGIADNV